MVKRFVAIGEAMIEMSGGENGLFRLGYAGDTLNTAWYMRALLSKDWQVDYMTALGTDRYSNEMVAFLAANGIGTDHIVRIPERRPGIYLIHQQEGDRHFTYWRDQSAARLLAEDRAALGTALAGADMVYFSGITMAILSPRARGRLLKAIVTARNAGAIVAFDTNLRPALWPSRRVMVSVLTAAASISDIVLPTHGDEAEPFGDADTQATAERYRSEGIGEVVVKNGKDPAYALTDTDMASASPVAGADVVDATGAGDSFNGGYLSARLEGLEPRTALERAHAVASIVIGERGALVTPERIRRAID